MVHHFADVDVDAWVSKREHQMATEVAEALALVGLTQLLEEVIPSLRALPLALFLPLRQRQ